MDPPHRQHRAFILFQKMAAFAGQQMRSIRARQSSVFNGICPQKASIRHPNDGLIDSLRQPSRIKDNEYVEDVADESRLLLFLLRTETVASPTLSRLLFAPTSEKNRRDSQTNKNFSHQNGEIRGSGSREASR